MPGDLWWRPRSSALRCVGSLGTERASAGRGRAGPGDKECRWLRHDTPRAGCGTASALVRATKGGPGSSGGSVTLRWRCVLALLSANACHWAGFPVVTDRYRTGRALVSTRVKRPDFRVPPLIRCRYCAVFALNKFINFNI